MKRKKGTTGQGEQSRVGEGRVGRELAKKRARVTLGLSLFVVVVVFAVAYVVADQVSVFVETSKSMQTIGKLRV